MNDRLNELAYNSEESDVENPSQTDSGSESESYEPEHMDEFYTNKDLITEWLTRLSEAIDQVTEANEDLTNAYTPDQAEECSQQLESLFDEAQGTISKLRNTLKELDTTNKELKESEGMTCHVRIRINTHTVLSKRFLSLVREYQEAQSECSAALKQTVERQYEISHGHEATPEEVQRLIETGEFRNFFKDQILEQGMEEALDAYDRVRERHLNIVSLEQSILDLQQIFVDFAILVDEQGEQLDQIDYVITANDQMSRANKYRKAAQKKTCCCIFIMLAVVFFLLGGWVIQALTSV